MKTIELSDELYEELKGFVADPFDDTAEIVIGRLITIANKAKDRWSPLDDCPSSSVEEVTMASRTRMSYEEPEGIDDSPVVL
ncbi:MAG: hypothetical protein JW720_01745 [Sedimentisphaerales bacterium]|nr:hypothetical protein [Sedimentisphaerales bacterium]